MPRHLISDAHEWINEIPTVPIYYLAKPQPRERAWQNQRGKKTLNQASTGSRAVCVLLVQWPYSCGGPRARQPGTGKPKGGPTGPSMVIPWRASRGRRNARKGVGWRVCPVIENQTAGLRDVLIPGENLP